jgi:protein involved in temperature-dependent protein secretion
MLSRRRSDRLSPRDLALKAKLEAGVWTRQELAWVLEADPRLPLVLAAIINGKLRALETSDSFNPGQADVPT